MTSFAHSPQGSQTEWETLFDHSNGVAGTSAANAAKFGAAEYGRAVGWLHDFGKVDPAFQARLKGSKAPFDHAGPGAAWVMKYCGRLGHLIAPVIAGHHTGLMDAVFNAAEDQINTTLERRLEGLPDRLAQQTIAALKDGLILPAKLPPPPVSLRPAAGDAAKTFTAFSCAFFTRMLFSALVDADFIETETFYGERDRGFNDVSLASLKQRLDAHLAAKGAKAAKEHPGPVNQARAGILAASRARAQDPQGIFTMTVPTGGGKTLASLTFAIDHAVQHKLDRVIVVIPFTAVAEQTAQVFREAFGDLGEAVLEHHGAFDDTKLRQGAGAPSSLDKLRLSQENWDAPVVVTTAVQFFESLFHHKTSRCRKLHNIARSVVILDEVQTLPLPVLRPAVLALDELARNYRASLVLTTATQPALVETDDPENSFQHGLRVAPDLMPDLPGLFQILKRVEIDFAGTILDAELAARMLATSQALAIVNTRKHARVLFDLIRDEPGARHLSTMMCAVHRAAVLEGIRADLKEGRPTRVVSTSLIEAGVDVDFPLVFRAQAGLDQIAQAAGRCNREGRRAANASRVIVFETEDGGKHAEMNQRWAATQAVMRAIESVKLTGGLLDPPAIKAYFREIYWLKGEEKLDEYGILKALRAGAVPLRLPLETISRNFQMIDDHSVPVIIPRDAKAEKAINKLRFAEKVGGIARDLQRYIVNVPLRDRAKLVRREAAEVLQGDKFGEQFVVLKDMGLYREDVGLDVSDMTPMEISEMIA
ncbi:MAG: CRISPR-associated helicase Cas3' [Beijerinckiaceae bacterium]